MHIPFETLFNEERTELRRYGYAIATLTIGTVTMHVVALRVAIEEDEDGEEMISYTGEMTGGWNDLDAILNLMGDGAGMPHLQKFEDNTYLIGAMPYAR